MQFDIYRKENKELIGMIDTNRSEQIMHKDFGLVVTNDSGIVSQAEVTEMPLIIRVKYFDKELYSGSNSLHNIDGKSDWIDLRARENIHFEAGISRCIPLGVAMQLPVGYEARVMPRSSTFKTWGLIQTNSVGLIDEPYCGDNDEWCMPVIATRRTDIRKGDRICQFRIEKHQPKVIFEEVSSLNNPDRGGFGSTGKN